MANTTHGSGWIVQILSTSKRLVKSYAPRIELLGTGQVRSRRAGLWGNARCRKDLNNPLTAVRGIAQKRVEPSGHQSKHDVKIPITEECSHSESLIAENSSS